MKKPFRYLILFGVLLASACGGQPAGDIEIPAATENPLPQEGDGRMEAVFIDSMTIEYPNETSPPAEAVIEGFFPDGCTSLDEAVQSQEGSTITIRLFTSRPEDAVCTMALSPFTIRVALELDDPRPGDVYIVDVYGNRAQFEYGAAAEPTPEGG